MTLKPKSRRYEGACRGAKGACEGPGGWEAEQRAEWVGAEGSSGERRAGLLMVCIGSAQHQLGKPLVEGLPKARHSRQTDTVWAHTRRSRESSVHRDRMVVARGWREEGMRSYYWADAEFQFRKTNKFWRWMLVMAAQEHECISCHRTIHLTMVRTVHWVPCISYQ